LPVPPVVPPFVGVILLLLSVAELFRLSSAAQALKANNAIQQTPNNTKNFFFIATPPIIYFIFTGLVSLTSIVLYAN
jgi:hypothetical protein